MTVDSALRRISGLIVRCLDPEEIVLFGSIAKGTADIHSDVDLLVIGEFRGPRHRRGHELGGLLDRYALRVDLHCFTRAELEIEARRPHGWIATLKATARPLYVRSPKKGKDLDTLGGEVLSDTQKSFCEAAFLSPDYSTPAHQALSREYHNFKCFRGELIITNDGATVNKILRKKRSGA